VSLNYTVAQPNSNSTWLPVAISLHADSSMCCDLRQRLQMCRLSTCESSGNSLLTHSPTWRSTVSRNGKSLVHRGDHYRALAHGRGDPFDRSGSHVTDGENAGTAGGQRLRQRVGGRRVIGRG
jgi:hypothetical protein